MLGKQWPIEASRFELVQFARLEEQPPVWARRLIERVDSRDLVDALDVVTDEILSKSNAIDTRQPYVWLLRVAEYLGATVERIDEPTSRLKEPATLEMRRRQLGWRRGIIHVDTDGHWRILIGSRHAAISRFDLAHELGHAILYRLQDGIDFEGWRSTRWCSQEEACCNYIARRLLMPVGLVPIQPLTGNLARYIVQIHGWRIPNAAEGCCSPLHGFL